MKSDVQISQESQLEPISNIASKLDIAIDHVLPYGRYKAKIDLHYVQSLINNSNQTDAKVVLVSAISPTPAGEGKTTTTIGLTDGLNRIGAQAVACLREPSLGPCFGVKGGGTGGGYAQVAPMDEINLHFTGDFHAITAAHNLLAAMIDNHIHWGNTLGIDPRTVVWKRVVDMNDRVLRNVVIGMGGVAHGTPRESGFDISVASEVMAIFCLSRDLPELQQRLGDITVAYKRNKQPVYARDLQATGAMLALLKDAFAPNLVQTLENNPAFLHGGPFANIAHGCNSVMATRLAMKLADVVVTEAGFGADLGAEKFFNIKCRKSGIKPNLVVVVATIRALKLHGGMALADLQQENVAAVLKGCENLGRHLRNLGNFGMPVVVALNAFASDTAAEYTVVEDYCKRFNVQTFRCEHWAKGGEGSADLAQFVLQQLRTNQAQFRLSYDDALPLWEKIRTLAVSLYGADDIIADQKIRDKIQAYQEQGWGEIPVCIAKTQYSFSTDPTLIGAPTGHVLPIRDVRLASGAGFLVVLCGSVMTMPGLPRKPSAEAIGVDEQSRIVGLF